MHAGRHSPPAHPGLEQFGPPPSGRSISAKAPPALPSGASPGLRPTMTSQSHGIEVPTCRSWYVQGRPPEMTRASLVWVETGPSPIRPGGCATFIGFRQALLSQFSGLKLRRSRPSPVFEKYDQDAWASRPSLPSSGMLQASHSQMADAGMTAGLRTK